MRVWRGGLGVGPQVAGLVIVWHYDLGKGVRRVGTAFVVFVHEQFSGWRVDRLGVECVDVCRAGEELRGSESLHGPLVRVARMARDGRASTL